MNTDNSLINRGYLKAFGDRSKQIFEFKTQTHTGSTRSLRIISDFIDSKPFVCRVDVSTDTTIDSILVVFDGVNARYSCGGQIVPLFVGVGGLKIKEVLIRFGSPILLATAQLFENTTKPVEISTVDTYNQMMLRQLFVPATRVDNYDSAIESLNTDVLNLKANIENLQLSTSRVNTRMSTLEGTIDSLDINNIYSQINQQVSQSLQALARRVAILENAVDAGHISTLENRISKLEMAVEEAIGAFEYTVDETYITITAVKSTYTKEQITLPETLLGKPVKLSEGLFVNTPSIKNVSIATRLSEGERIPNICKNSNVVAVTLTDYSQKLSEKFFSYNKVNTIYCPQNWTESIVIDNVLNGHDTNVRSAIGPLNWIGAGDYTVNIHYENSVKSILADVFYLYDHQYDIVDSLGNYSISGQVHLKVDVTTQEREDTLYLKYTPTAIGQELVVDTFNGNMEAYTLYIHGENVNLNQLQEITMNDCDTVVFIDFQAQATGNIDFLIGKFKYISFYDESNDIITKYDWIRTNGMIYTGLNNGVTEEIQFHDRTYPVTYQI